MGTRAIYTFRDELSEHHVYKHWDGHPEGASSFIVQGLAYAWKLPRYEADEMVCAFIAANKKMHTGGDLRMLPSGPIEDVSPCDVEYWYEVFQAPNAQLIVKAHKVDAFRGFKTEEVFYGRLADFAAHYDEEAYQLYRLMYPSTSKQKAA